jgi:hypothetical protein
MKDALVTMGEEEKDEQNEENEKMSESIDWHF